MKIMRNTLRELVAPNGTLSGSLNSANAGLLLQRGLSQWDKDDKSAKEDLIERIGKISRPDLYNKAYQRWLKITSDNSRYAFTAAKIVGRLYTGLSSATALETGISTHHTYGMPMLAGSSIKGAVANYAEQIELPENIRRMLFGDENNAGAVVWHDAWWIPSSGQPFVGEIITVHHQDYYSGQQEKADELEDPVPNQQIATQGSFYFVVEAVNQTWAEFAKNLLLQMLANQGMGSKTASGYGYFEYDKKISDDIANSRVAKDDLAGQLNLLNETNLMESLSKDVNSFLREHGLDKSNDDDMKELVSAILENPTLKGYVDSWEMAQTDSKNQQKAVKFIQKYRSS